MEILRRHKAGELKSDLAKEYGLSSPALINHRVWQVNKGGPDALRPKPKGRPKSSARPAPVTEEEKLRRPNGRPNSTARPAPETEEDKLRRENELLKAEVAYLKK
ncbi:hypothetical protein [Corynebacterium diphtheriae]|uniref:hypothetical protein n=1 Tax=Corynebacterium diphtheriae TaxID=1717 RepID=UPI000D060104